MSAGGIEISPYAVVAQWRNLAHELQVNIWNFEVKAAGKAEEIFKKSFSMKRFNATNSTAWPARSPKSKGNHPLLVETGSLRNSIHWKKVNPEAPNVTMVTVYTDPHWFSYTARHQGFCYAAIHNVNKASFKTGNAAKIPQRQFMGHSDILKKEMDTLASEIFLNFP